MATPISSQRQRVMHGKMNGLGKATPTKGKKLPEKAPRKKARR